MGEGSDNRTLENENPDQADNVVSPYSDAYYRRAADRASTSYSPAHGGSVSSGKSKNTRTAAILFSLGVICVLTAALLGLGGTFFVFRASADGAEAETSYVQEIYEEYTLSAEQTASSEASLSLVSSEGREELSATEIYEMVCHSVVGVAIPGESSNVFGQSSSTSVTGSGIVLTDDGYILTNYHVIKSAYESGTEIRVMTFEEDEYEAEIVGAETDSDLAVLKIPAEGLIPAELGDSDDIQVGMTIYTIGHPLGELTYTMTEGIISALDRQITTDTNVTVNMFQIDAAVNDGNSGGPVLNAYGQVIGVVTAKYVIAGAEGLGFAIPMTEACEIANELMTDGYVAGKAYLGLTMTTVSESVARFYDMVTGVYVSAVEPGSCAEEAGIQAGDIITAVDGVTVSTNSDLVQAIKAYRAGDNARLTLYRDGQYLTVTVVFDEELPADSSTTGSDAEPELGQEFISF